MGEHNLPEPGTVPTRRELQVLWLTAHGLGRKGVAAQMAISSFTVKTHLRRVSWRLQSADAAHSVALCFRTGLFPLPGRAVLTANEIRAAESRRA